MVVAPVVFPGKLVNIARRTEKSWSAFSQKSVNRGQGWLCTCKAVRLYLFTSAAISHSPYIRKPVGMNIPVDPPRFSRTAGLGGGIFIRTRLIHTTAHMHGHHEATINGAGWVELGCVKA